MIRLKKEMVDFRVFVRNEKDKKSISFPVINGHNLTKEIILELCKEAILNYYNKTKGERN
jgi:hypothetical protein